MKNASFPVGSGSASSAAAKLDAAVGFLSDRRQSLALSPVGRASVAAYVWRRVFLKGRSAGR